MSSCKGRKDCIERKEIGRSILCIGRIGDDVGGRRYCPYRLLSMMWTYKLQNHPVDEQNWHPTPNQGATGPH